MAVSIEGGLNIEHTHLPTLFTFFRIHVLRCREGPLGRVISPLQSVQECLYEETYYLRCEASFIVISCPSKRRHEPRTGHVTFQDHKNDTLDNSKACEHEVGDAEQRMSRLGSAARRKARCHIGATQGHFRAIEKI